MKSPYAQAASLKDRPFGQAQDERGQTRYLLPLLTLATSLAFAACTSTGWGSGSSFPSELVSPGSSGLKTAPDFEVTVFQGEEVLGGEKIMFSDLIAQGKPVVLNFWAGLCPPCRAEMPDLQEIHVEYQGQVLIFGLDVGPFVGLGSRDEGRALLEELKVTYPAGTTFDANVVRDYQILGMPTTVFIKPSGEVVRIWTGLLNRDKMNELVEELLAASSGT